MDLGWMLAAAASVAALRWLATRAGRGQPETPPVDDGDWWYEVSGW